ncbi:APO protein 3, mitochondrial-like [Salvia miltiorrhiza]|uniref:APO protein 3, mitochondrial-like n=1 Tax=Salvia miltiorrhiza TaxID=226208 RepID=UPI0025ACF7E1|nr:APO protein 3, mitochondrial-like [Salvia miltiorrhiza]
MFHTRLRTMFRQHQSLARSVNFSAETCSPRALCPATASDFVELPRKLKRSERKPWVTDVTELKRRERWRRQARRVVREVKLKPPDNGLLVKELIPVARDVLAARTRLLSCVSRVSDSVPIFVCRVCGDVHIGDPPHKIRSCDVSGSLKSKEHVWKRGGVDCIVPVVESFHLYDRLGRAVSHEERLEVDRVPAILELCIQGGVDMPEYPTRRRDFPVYLVAGRLIDFEKRFPKNGFSGKDINIRTSGFWQMRKRLNEDRGPLDFPCNDLKECAEQGMEALEKLRSGVGRLMKKYGVITCAYCSEVQVGPKGHRVRLCKAFKHQMRDGQHDWQEATFDDIFPPVYVWHVPNQPNSLLVDALKRYYGKSPALVELFAQAGAQLGENYRGIMRADVVVPSLDEERLAV